MRGIQLTGIITLTTALLLVTACGGRAPESATSEGATETGAVSSISEPAAQPTPTPVPPSPAPEPTATPEMASGEGEAAEESAQVETEPTAAPAEAMDWLTVSGKTDDGYNYLGNPDAPITITDFSDFM